MLLSFYQRFVPKIENGIKIHTMRDDRKNEPKTGETLYMYTGSYNASRALICATHKLHSTQRVRIEIWVHERNMMISIDDRYLDQTGMDKFFINDGFDNGCDFVDYWVSKLPKRQQKEIPLIIQWSGNLYHWTNLKY